MGIFEALAPSDSEGLRDFEALGRGDSDISKRLEEVIFLRFGDFAALCGINTVILKRFVSAQ